MPIGYQIGPIGVLPSGIGAEKVGISGQVSPGGLPGRAGPPFRRAKTDSPDRETFARVPARGRMPLRWRVGAVCRGHGACRCMRARARLPRAARRLAHTAHAFRNTARWARGGPRWRRPRLSKEKLVTVPVKFPESVVAQIGERTDNRSDFTRKAVLACL